jgi:chromosome partitioning protein
MLAINLAAAAVEIGIKPLIICQDPQGTSINYYKGGNLPFEVIGHFTATLSNLVCLI